MLAYWNTIHGVDMSLHLDTFILISSQPIFPMILIAANSNLIAYGFIGPGSHPRCTWGEHANHYTTLTLCFTRYCPKLIWYCNCSDSVVSFVCHYISSVHKFHVYKPESFLVFCEWVLLSNQHLLFTRKTFIALVLCQIHFIVENHICQYTSVPSEW